MTSKCSYLYGVVPADQARDVGPIGLDGGDVRTVSEGGIGIVLTAVMTVGWLAFACAFSLLAS